ncbi:hypothetical protein CsSME_00020053 [Camellia sinensis var. sinensis]
MNERASTAAILSGFRAILYMALLTFVPPPSQSEGIIINHPHGTRSRTCIEQSKVHDPSKASGRYAKLGSCSSKCSFKDVVLGNTSRVVHKADNSPESSSLAQETRLLSRKAVNGSTSNRSLFSSARSNASGVTHTSSSSRGIQASK